MNDRIKLAKAMGWKRIGITLEGKWHGGVPNEFPVSKEIPDPFADANEDYAVLEWARETELEGFQEALEELCCKTPAGYRLGNYARAALKVLG